MDHNEFVEYFDRKWEGLSPSNLGKAVQTISPDPKTRIYQYPFWIPPDILAMLILTVWLDDHDRPKAASLTVQAVLGHTLGEEKRFLCNQTSMREHEGTNVPSARTFAALTLHSVLHQLETGKDPFKIAEEYLKAMATGIYRGPFPESLLEEWGRTGLPVII